MIPFDFIILQKFENVIKLHGLVTDAETSVAFVAYTIGVITLIKAFQAENFSVAGKDYDVLIEVLQFSIDDVLTLPFFLVSPTLKVGFFIFRKFLRS